MRSLALAIIFAAVIIVCGNILPFKAEAVDHHGFEIEPRFFSYDECLLCHEITSAEDIPESLQVCTYAKIHPLNHVYPPPDRKDKFKPVGALSKEGIILINDKIDCISCHDLLQKTRNYLRFEFGENFCKTCHIR